MKHAYNKQKVAKGSRKHLVDLTKFKGKDMVDYRDLKGAFKSKGPYAKLIHDVDYFNEYRPNDVQEILLVSLLYVMQEHYGVDKTDFYSLKYLSRCLDKELAKARKYGNFGTFKHSKIHFEAHEYYKRYRKEKLEETGIYARHTSRKYEDAEKFVLFCDMILEFISNVHCRLEKANEQHQFIRSLLHNKIQVNGESLEKYLNSFLNGNSTIDGYFSNLFADKLAQLDRIKRYFSDKEWRYQNYKAYIEFDKKSEQTQHLRKLYKEYDETWLYLYLGIQEQFGILVDAEDCNKVTLNISHIKQKIGSMQ